MTTKQFFKSTIFRCIVVLLCIALISGGLLAILNDLWAVPEEEVINRAINSVCGKDVSLKAKLDITEEHKTNEYGTIDNAYLLSNDKYLIQSTGGEGYHSGKISCYILASKDGVIESISIASYSSSQTLMSKFTGVILEEFKKNPNDYVATGASYSSNAIRNAIKSAQFYLDTYLTKEGE